MPDTDFISNWFLNEELKFINSKRYRNGHLWVVEKVRNDFEICPKCTSKSSTRYGKATSLVREVGIRKEPLWLEIHKHRYFCKTCKKPFTEPVKGVFPRRRTTQRFRKSIREDCDNFDSLSKVRRHNTCSSGLVYQVFYEQLEIKLRQRKGIHWPKYLGVDEHFFSRNKGYAEFVTVFTNLKKRKLFEVACGKSKLSLIEQLKAIPGRENVKIVCIDLSNGYRSFVKEMFPNAKIVADKFHVLRLPVPEFLKRRKEIHGHRQDLKQRRLLLKSRVRLDYFVRADIDNYLKKHPELDEVYRAKERLMQFYRTKGFKKAVRAFGLLIKSLESSKLAALQKLKRTLKKWKNEILLYFEQKVTNGLTEVMNRNAKQLQSRACGYKNFKNYRLMLLSACSF